MNNNLDNPNDAKDLTPIITESSTHYWKQFISILPDDKRKLSEYYIIEEVYNTFFKKFRSAFDNKEEYSKKLNAGELYGSPIREIGNGNFGKVYLWEKNDNSVFAVKNIKINFNKNIKHECNRVFGELIICYNLDHPSIVKSIDLLTGPKRDEFLLVQNYVEGLTLKEAISSNNLFYLPKFSDYIFKQIVILTKYIHDHGIGHNDLKPANIIMNPITYQIKIIDFGLSRFLSDFLDSDLENNLLKSGTSRYLPPELNFPKLNNYRNDLSIKRIIKSKDIWSIGLIYYNMISKGDNLWEISHPSDIQFSDYKERTFIPRFQSILDYLNDFFGEEQEEIINASRRIMFYGMLNLYNNRRIPIDYILDSYWFKNIPDTLILTQNDIDKSNELLLRFEGSHT